MARLRALALFSAALLFTAPCAARDLSPEIELCIDSAARERRIDRNLIKAIIHEESRGDPLAMNTNTNTSRDIGIMQINSSWLPMLKKHGIAARDLLDPCTNIQVGAWVLAGNIARFGMTWKAIGAYNAASTDKRIVYASKVMAAWRRIEVESEAGTASRASKQG